MCPGQVVQNIRYSVPPTCVDNWYYRTATEVRIKPGMNSACSHVHIFSSDRRLYIQNYVNAHTFCDLHQYLHKHITTNSHHRLLNFAVCDTAIFSLSGTEEAYSTYARHLTINFMQWTQYNTNNKACRWKWPWAIRTNLPRSDINVIIPSSNQCSTWALCYRVSLHVSTQSSSLPVCSTSLILYWMVTCRLKITNCLLMCS